ncbi:phage antirepressor [Caproiciproducens sp.]
MNDLQIFKSNEFGEIRTFKEPDGSVLFCGSDTAKALGYANPSKAVSDHCKGVTKRETLTAGGIQQLNFISKGDLCRLAASSQLPGADKFESWIFDEVIPSVLEHGAYATPDTLDKMISSPEFGIKLLTELKKEQEQRKVLESKVESDKPKVLFADAVATSESPMLIGELAKVIKQNGVDIGEKRLFGWLRENGYLIRRKGTDYNAPTQKSMEMGLFRVKETAITHSDGHVTVNRTTKVTGKGQQYFINKFLGGEDCEAY